MIVFEKWWHKKTKVIHLQFGNIIGAVLGLVICLVLHYWNKVNKE